MAIWLAVGQALVAVETVQPGTYKRIACAGLYEDWTQSVVL